MAMREVIAKPLINLGTRAWNKVLRAGFPPRPDHMYECERIGSDYGGYHIVLTGISKSTIIYSLGVGEDASFDIALIERFGLTVHAFDPTPKSIVWVTSNNLSNNFKMHNVGIAAFDGEMTFYPPDNPSHVSHTIYKRSEAAHDPISFPVKRLSTVMKELGHSHIDVLKMDIEGAEYSVIDDLLKSGIRPQQMLIEFHHRFNNVGVGMTRKAIGTIRKMGYGIFYASASSDDMGFVRVK